MARGAAPFYLVPALSAPTTSAIAQRKHSSRSSWSAPPSVEQTLAISNLLPFNDSTIIAWLILIRSVEPGLKCRPGAGHLTAQQLDALSSLSTSCDKNVKAWLSFGRRQSSSTNSQRSSQCSTLAESRFSRASSTTADTFASLALGSTLEDPLETSDPDQQSNLQKSSTLDAGENNLDLYKELPPNPPSPRLKQEYRHFVTSRKHDRPIMTCDGFKRQEMEQTRSWVFMPLGPIENSPQGTRCALCPTRDPDIEHLKYHGTQEYASRSEPIRKSRKGEFEKVLEKHKALKEWYPDFVEKWCANPPKKAYSCGFCVKLFKTFSERNRHLCDAHFHRGEDMTMWHITNLIRGLLLQEDVNRAYREMFGWDPSDVDCHRAWRSSSLEDLQHRLEEGRESPHELASAAYAAMKHTEKLQSSHDTSETGSQFTANPQHMQASSMTPECQVIPSLSTSMLTEVAPKPSTRMLPENLNAHQSEHLGMYGTAPMLSSEQHNPIDLTSAFNPPMRSDSLAPGFMPQPNAAARMTGGSSEVTHAGPDSSQVQRSWSSATAEMNQDFESHMLVPCALCLYSHLPWEECDSGQQPALDLVMDSYFSPDYPMPEPEPDDTAVPRFSTAKRKLSDETAAVANRIAQTLSPNESFVQW